MRFFDRLENQDSRPGVWLDESFFTSTLKPLNGIEWIWKEDLNILYQFCVFRADQKTKMAILANPSTMMALYSDARYVTLWKLRTTYEHQSQSSMCITKFRSVPSYLQNILMNQVENLQIISEWSVTKLYRSLDVKLKSTTGRRLTNHFKSCQINQQTKERLDALHSSTDNRHRVIYGVESWNGVVEWSGVGFGVEWSGVYFKFVLFGKSVLNAVEKWVYFKNTTAMAFQFKTFKLYWHQRCNEKEAQKPFQVFDYTCTWNILDTWDEFYGSETILN